MENHHDISPTLEDRGDCRSDQRYVCVEGLEGRRGADGGEGEGMCGVGVGVEESKEREEDCGGMPL